MFYKEKRAAIGKILRQLCEWKGVKIIEVEACPDHIHLFVEIPPKLSISGFMGYLKGKSSTMLYEQFGELKYKYRNREFWCRGYYVDTVGKNETRIAEYIRNQLKEDELGEQMTIASIGPFAAASNNPCAAGRPYYARNRGLCPHRKNPQFYWGLLLVINPCVRAVKMYNVFAGAALASVSRFRTIKTANFITKSAVFLTSRY